MKLEIEYGSDILAVNIPLSCDVKEMRQATVLTDPAGDIIRSYKQPIGTPPLSELALEKVKETANPSVVIVVSDNTRPVPYRGKNGILIPLLQTLIKAGCAVNRIAILIGKGSHRPMTDAEIEAMLGLRESGFDIPVFQHDYEDKKNLAFVGKTRRDSPVHINKLYIEADIKIITGLVESHFMAGASGGRKAICPAIASKETLRIFHEPEILGSPRSADLVLIPAGFVGVNHYQAAKAAIEASKAVKPGGVIIIVARHSDPDPVGSENYKKTLALLKHAGPHQFLQTLKSPDWVFTHDQWEAQMWSKVLDVLGDEGTLIYCSLEIPEQEYSILPGIPGHTFCSREELKKMDNQQNRMQRIIEQSVISAVQQLQKKNGRKPDMLFLKNGPYGVPEVLPDNSF